MTHQTTTATADHQIYTYFTTDEATDQELWFGEIRIGTWTDPNAYGDDGWTHDRVDPVAGVYETRWEAEDAAAKHIDHLLATR